jgi:uncharacterized repeat protein (TIGR03806 family)
MRIARLATLAWMCLVPGRGLADDAPLPTPAAAPVPWTTSRLAGSPEPPLPYTVERTFDKLDLKTPIYVIEEPGTANLFAVLYAAGALPTRVVRFANDPSAEKFETLYETTDRLYSICFDPDYAANRRIYVFRNLAPPNVAERQNRVSRFTLDAGPTGRIDPKSEEVILEWGSDGHDGGDMAFGTDGMFYLTTGDGTGDSDTWNSGQTLDDLLGAVLRIDLRNPSDGKPYRIPPDNPFVDTPGARGEIWAYGLRNPWRMSVDPPTGHLWVGTNGQDLWETAHLVRRGENYGWSVYEGSHPFYLERKRGPTPLVPPTIEHSHAEFRSLTGGVVYHGDVLPELEGAYIYGDYSTGRIWGMKHDGAKSLWHKELADTSLMIAAFRVVPGGQLLVADHGSGLYRLVPTPKGEPGPPFPTKLSQTGLFAAAAEHQPDAALLPYSVNAPGWADGATAERFIALPERAQIDYSSGSWTFPNGTALVQTLSLERKLGKPESRVRVETRVLLRQQNEWAGYSYRWNEEQSDATLVAKDGADGEFELDGGRRQKWRFPSRTECLTCHSRAANFVLGVTEAQLNRPHGGATSGENQLATFERLGVFSKPLPKPPGELAKLANPYDSTHDLDARARAYLQVNCSVCHVSAGGGNAKMELGVATERAKMELIEARPQHDSFGIANAMLVAPGDPDRSVLVHRLARRGRGQMPPLVSARVDDAAVELLRSWIATIPPNRPLVQAWKMDDLAPALEELKSGRSVETGRTAFRDTGCAQCHRLGGEGGTVGPDLTDVARRLSTAELLEAIIEPSKKIADEYATWLVQTDDGQTLSGRIDREDERLLVLRETSSTVPPREIDKSTVIARRKADTSNMPAGIVNVLHKHEILDLLAYLLAAEKPK